ncbi:MAG: bifunctional demethylmenaquinone methyltransferase/2-methoxy-6-polyprenyl-1,4-benzoquinol methylase UbiE [bacterium]|nr:bifunctional demethylmenaquinone methyltransferase/2-methoxy-6-polyprenyl-1,4-benzoquinol methylase UbiE [bacterium]
MPAQIESGEVREMFSDIAPTYDLLNHLLSLGIDRRWRRRAVQLLLDGGGSRYLDIATGTGDVALEILRQKGGAGLIAGADFSLPMLRLAGEKTGAGNISYLQADGLGLPFADGVFDGAAIAFGLRNFEDRAAGLAEMARVLRPGGRLIILEFGRPEGLFGLIYRLYFRAVLPVAGRIISGHPTAYRYLPETVYAFPDAEALSAMLRAAGFEEVAAEPLMGGIALIHSGRRS